jgi:phosphoribosylformylglycinamidine synthase subunit PurQ / glutaminase
MKPTVLILHAPGTNRDTEAARACELAGGRPDIVHINQLRAGERTIGEYDMLLLPGGFTYGDALGAGARLALDLQIYLHDMLQTFVSAGKPVLGICNGFQTLVKAGILPGQLESSQPAPHWTNRAVTLTTNASDHFECRWVHLSVPDNVRTPFLQGFSELIYCPVAHGEGNFQAKDAATVDFLNHSGLVAFRYVNEDGTAAGGRYPANPNGSVDDIAGICNPAGNVIGLMPHPEDHIVPIQNPHRRHGQLGLAIFTSMLRVLV